MAAIKVRTMKTRRQEPKTKICPPMRGATTGARPLTTMRRERSLAKALPLAKSRATALEITTPIEPIKPAKKRATSKPSIDCDRAQAKVARAQSILPMMRGRLRPKISEIGPPKSWPIAIPITVMDRVNWMLEGLV